MPERTEPTGEAEPHAAGTVGERIRRADSGLVDVLAEAEQTWRDRARGEAAEQRPGWRPFEDAFPTFYQFTNRPR
jgi:hypothetical protein